MSVQLGIQEDERLKQQALEKNSSTNKGEQTENKQDENVSLFNNSENTTQEESEQYNLLKFLKSSGLEGRKVADSYFLTNYYLAAESISEESKQRIIEENTNEEGDLELQAKVAAMFYDVGNSAMKCNDFISNCQKYGFDIEIVNGDGQVTSDFKSAAGLGEGGTFRTYKISDGNATILIADTNGNGSLEVGEVMFNQILQEVDGVGNFDSEEFKALVDGTLESWNSSKRLENKDVTVNAGSVAGNRGSSRSSSQSIFNTKATGNEEVIDETLGNIVNLTQMDFNKEVEALKGEDLEAAVRKINQKYGTNFTYTGNN